MRAELADRYPWLLTAADHLTRLSDISHSSDNIKNGGEMTMVLHRQKILLQISVVISTIKTNFWFSGHSRDILSYIPTLDCATRNLYWVFRINLFYALAAARGQVVKETSLVRYILIFWELILHCHKGLFNYLLKHNFCKEIQILLKEYD